MGNGLKTHDQRHLEMKEMNLVSFTILNNPFLTMKKQGQIL